MAGINLAGAIGLGGKLESVNSGTAAMTNDLTKTLLGTLQQQQEKEDKKKEVEQAKLDANYAKFAADVDVTPITGVKTWDEDYANKAKKGLADMAAIYADPNKSRMQKQIEMNKIHDDIAREHNYYKQFNNDAEKTMAVLSSGKYETSKANDILLNKDLGEESPLFGKPMHEMTSEELRQAYPNGVSNKIAPNLVVKRAPIGEVVKEVIGFEPNFVQRVTKDINGVKVPQDEVDEKTKVDFISGMTANILAKRGEKASQMWNGFYDDLWKASSHIKNPQEREAFIQERIPEMAKRAATEYVDRRIAYEKNANKSIDLTPNKEAKESKGLNITFGGGGKLDKYNIGKPLVVDYKNKMDKSKPSVEQKEFFAIQTISPSDNPPTIAIGNAKGILQGVYKNKSGDVDAVSLKTQKLDEYGNVVANQYETKIIPIKDKQELEVLKTNIGEGFDDAIGLGKSGLANKSQTKSVPSQPIENETETVLKSMVTEDKHDKVIGEYQKSKELELIHGEDWLPMQLKGTNVTPKEVKVVSKKHNVDEKKVVAVIKSSKKENLTTSNWKTNVDKIAQGLSKKQIKTDSIHDKYDIRSYATAPNHEKIVDNVYKNIKHLETKEDIDNYIKDKSVGSNITGSMILNTAKKYDVEPQAIIALIQIDSSFGTKGKGARTNNPGNVGNDDSGRTVTYKTWQDGVDAVGAQLAKRKIQKEYIPSQPKKKSKKATDYGL